MFGKNNKMKKLQINTSFISELLDSTENNTNLRLTTKEGSVDSRIAEERKIELRSLGKDLKTYTIEKTNKSSKRVNLLNRTLTYYNNFIKKLKTYDEEYIKQAIQTCTVGYSEKEINERTAVLIELYDYRIKLLEATKSYIYFAEESEREMYIKQIKDLIKVNKELSNKFAHMVHNYSFIQLLKTKLVAFGYGWY